MVSAVISRLAILIFGTLYPAYRSYKAVATKDVKEYVKWMMYWITFAVFTCLETLADILVSFWMPFYYELKILVIIWLLSPYTRGASYLYRKTIHPTLARHEDEIDQYLDRFRKDSLMVVKRLGNQGLTYAREVVANVAIKSQAQLAQQIRKTQSMNDLSAEPDLLDYGAPDVEEECYQQQASVPASGVVRIRTRRPHSQRRPPRVSEPPISEEGSFEVGTVEQEDSDYVYYADGEEIDSPSAEEGYYGSGNGGDDGGSESSEQPPSRSGQSQSESATGGGGDASSRPENTRRPPSGRSKGSGAMSPEEKEAYLYATLPRTRSGMKRSALSAPVTLTTDDQKEQQ